MIHVISNLSASFTESLIGYKFSFGIVKIFWHACIYTHLYIYIVICIYLYIYSLIHPEYSFNDLQQSTYLGLEIHLKHISQHQYAIHFSNSWP